MNIIKKALDILRKVNKSIEFMDDNEAKEHLGELQKELDKKKTNTKS